MQEKNLVFVSLLCCLSGTLLILFMAERNEPELYSASSIDSSLEGSKVLVQGYLESIENFEKLTKFTIKDMTGSITSVVFEDDLRLKQDAFIMVKGEVTVFNNKTEISAKEIHSS